MNYPKTPGVDVAKPRKFYHTYEDISELVDLSLQNVYKFAEDRPGRTRLNMDSLESVVVFLARHGKLPLRVAIMRAALERTLPEEELARTPGTVRRRKTPAPR